MCFKTGKHEPFADALKCFENGHMLISSYREKYGFTYRKTIRDAVQTMGRMQTMKVKELLAALEVCDPETVVVIALEHDRDDRPDDYTNPEGFKFAPRHVSTVRKNARQFDGQDRDRTEITIKSSDY
jgi:hypothetical protein